MAELLGFTTEQVSRLTGLSENQLFYWDRTGFFSPTHSDPGRAFGRVYVFRDVVGLKVISVLRLRHDVPLQELRKVREWLLERFEEPWSTLRFGLSGKTVIFLDPETGAHTEARGQGQHVSKVFCIEDIANEMSKAAERLRDRGDKVGQIEKRRQVASSHYVVAGTRVHTEAIWNFHEAGFSTKEILKEYPHLKPGDIEAAIKFESDKRQAA